MPNGSAAGRRLPPFSQRRDDDDDGLSAVSPLVGVRYWISHSYIILSTVINNQRLLVGLGIVILAGSDDEDEEALVPVAEREAAVTCCK